MPTNEIPPNPSPRTGFRTELAWAGGVFFAAAVLAMVYVSTWGQTPHFHQEFFGPSLMWASGRGWVNPQEGVCPEMDAFLHPPMNTSAPPLVDRFDPAALPEQMPTAPMLHIHDRHLHLLAAVAMCWRLFGIAWSSLTPLYGLLFGLAVLAAYGLFRLAMRRSVALFCALMLASSPLHLHYLPRLRDYGKTPFILIALFLMGLLVRHKLSSKHRCALAALCGAVAGVGVGFRTDVLIALPAFVVTLIFFQSGKPWRAIPAKLGALLCLAIGYTLFSWPITARLEKEGNKFHPAMLGFAEAYDSRLGVGDAPYQWIHRHHDIEPMAMTHAYAGAVNGAYHQFDFETPEYERYADPLFLRVARTLPGDLVTRAYAAVLRVMDEMRPAGDPPLPRGISNAFLQALYRLWGRVNQACFAHGRYLALLALVLIAAYNVRCGFAALFFWLFFAGYTSIYYSGRNSFHLEFMIYWAGGFLISSVLDLLTRLSNKEAWPAAIAFLRSPAGWRAPALRLAIFTGVALAGIAIPWYGLRLQQERALLRLFESYEAANWQAVTPQAHALKGERILLQAPPEAGRDALPVEAGAFYFHAALLRVEVDTRQGPVTLQMRYAPEQFEYNLDFAMHVPQHPGETPCQVYFPAFYASWNTHYVQSQIFFRGIEVEVADREKVLRIDYARNTKAYPLLMSVVLPEDWREGRCYKRFTR